MDVKYFKQCESEDYEKLLSFNEKACLFKELIPAERLTYYDVSASTVTDIGARIELKKRNTNTFMYHTLFIEDTKLNIVLDYLCYGDIPLYINFMKDGNVVIFNLSKLSKRPEYNERRTYSKGYNSWEYQGKNELDMCDAWIYDYDAKLIQSPRWKQQKNS